MASVIASHPALARATGWSRRSTVAARAVRRARLRGGDDGRDRGRGRASPSRSSTTTSATRSGSTSPAWNGRATRCSRRSPRRSPRPPAPARRCGAGVRAFFAFLDADRAAWAVLFDETLPHGGEVAERVADYRGRILDLVAASILAPAAAATPRRRAKVEVEALSDRAARRRRGARPLVAAHRGDLRRGGGRAADRDDRAGPAPALGPVARKTTSKAKSKGNRK